MSEKLAPRLIDSFVEKEISKELTKVKSPDEFIHEFYAMAKKRGFKSGKPIDEKEAVEKMLQIVKITNSVELFRKAAQVVEAIGAARLQKEVSNQPSTQPA